MSSTHKTLTEAYYALSSLYKNPTRSLNGMAASNQDAELAIKHAKLLALFSKSSWDSRAEKPALYFKVLSLLYEVDDYRGLSPEVEEEILAEYPTLIEHFNTRGRLRRSDAYWNADFKNPEVRSLWKAKVLCYVATVESRRKSSPLNVLLDELKNLEAFVRDNLHKPQDALPAWTTLAFVQTAQARVARQNQAYLVVEEKLQSAVHCLNERATEIIEKLIALHHLEVKTKAEEGKTEDLIDDLIFIRQKQTLSILFNVGLANLQRGFLRSAAYACQAARLQFRLHGQFFHRLFNELVILSIRRAQISRDDTDEFRKLKDEIERDILPSLNPDNRAGNPRLYLYALREKALLQYYCDELTEALATLDSMEKMRPSDQQWNARISILRARTYLRQSRRPAGEATLDNDDLLQTALTYSEAAFTFAAGLKGGIGSYRNAKSLLVRIEGSTNKKLLDTLESLITYGTAQLFLHNYSEAKKSAEVVIELCKDDDNPRLLAMGHLVMAEAYIGEGLSIKAQQHLASAKALECRIDHKYVEDRRIAVENLMPSSLDLSGFSNDDFSKAEDMLLCWFIDHKTQKSSVKRVAEELHLDRRIIDNLLIKLDNPETRYAAYRHLTKIKRKRKS